jgi:branched-chain amino acid transport system substrate-binding protein
MSLAVLMTAASLVAACGNSTGASEAETGSTGGATNESTAAAATSEPSSEEPIVFGFSIGQTGFLQFYEVPLFEAAKIRIDEINAAGGINGRQIEVRVLDNGSDAAKSAAAAEKLIEEGADVLFTTCDGDIGGPAARVANDQGVLAIGCAGSPLYGVTGIGPLVFNTDSGANNEGAVMAQWAFDQGYRTAVSLADDIIAITKDTCKFFGETFEKLGGTMVDEKSFNNADPSVASQVRAIQAANPDVVALCSVPPGGASALKQIRAVSDVPVVSGIGMDGTFWTDGIPTDVLEGLHVQAYGAISGDDPDPARQAVLDKYKEATGEAAQLSVVQLGYASVQMIERAIAESGGTDGAQMAAVLNKFNQEDFVSGPMTYTDTCHISSERPLVINQFVDGQYLYETTVTPSYVPETIC